MEKKLYQALYETLSDVLPTGWKRIVYYAQYFEGSYSMKYYVDSGNGKYIDCFSLGIGKKEIIDVFIKMDKLIAEERAHLPEKKKWTVMTMSINEKGRFKVNYDYEDISDNTISYTREWKKKYLV